MIMKSKKLVIFDLDGTLYLDGVPFPGVKELIASIREHGIHVAFLTNNSSKSTASYFKKLVGMGLAGHKREVITSTQAAISHILKIHQNVPFHVLGTDDVIGEIEDAGVRVIRDDTVTPGGVLLTYDTALTYEKICQTTALIRKAPVYLATHPDMVCPTQNGPVPDVGTFIAMFEAATGRRPHVLGKPEADMLLVACDRFGVSGKDALMVGDRLYTDIRAGINAGIETALVLTGETTEAMLEQSPLKPEHVLSSVLDIWPLL
jgi:4-nitrophenyl phosphatase